jgi:hypothetical protein
MKKNSHKFLEEMSEDELRIIESIAGNTIDKLGYERFKINRGYEQRFTKQDIEQFEKENELRKQNIVNVIDPGDMKRRKKQDGVIQRIISFSEEIESVTRVA